MRPYNFLLLFIFVMPFFASAQQGRQNYRQDARSQYEPSSISIFSENGEQFFLVLNGISQNNVPVSRIRVEGLPQYGNDIEIVFADRRTPAIRKRLTIADPVDGKAVDMTLKITWGRGYPVLKFYRCTEVERNYRPERDECVMSYGRPTQTNTVVTTTTTYNTTPMPVPMDGRTFADAKNAISNASFEDTKLSTAKTVLSSNYVSVNQVIEICHLFSFDNTKLAFAKFAYSKTVDQNNYYKVGNVFSFDSDRQALNDFITHAGR